MFVNLMERMIHNDVIEFPGNEFVVTKTQCPTNSHQFYCTGLLLLLQSYT